LDDLRVLVDRELAELLALAQQLCLFRLGPLLTRLVLAVHGVDQVVVLAVRLEEEELGLLPIELSQPEAQAGHFLLIWREADDLLQRVDLLVALGSHLQLYAQAELVVLQRRGRSVFVFFAREIAGQRLVRRGRGPFLETRFLRVLLLSQVLLSFRGGGEYDESYDERSAHETPNVNPSGASLPSRTSARESSGIFWPSTTSCSETHRVVNRLDGRQVGNCRSQRRRGSRMPVIGQAR